MPASNIFSLPATRWRDSKRLRLEALRQEPTAFAASYADELAFSDDVWLARLRSARQRANNMTFYAELDGKLVGMAGANWSQREKLRHVAEIYSVYVSPGQRGKGIASQLLRRILAELSLLPQIEKVRLSVNGHCLPAIRLYERLGFEQIGRARRELKVAGSYFDLLYMERLIRSD